jgi:hypothetical protein
MRRSSPLTWLIGVGLVLQLALLWLHGELLYRQRQDLLEIHRDLQELAELVDQSAGGPMEGGGPLAPARHQPRRRRRQAQVIHVQESPKPEEDPVAKELQASRESGAKAVKDAREMQSKLSITENARKAEEKAKVDAAKNQGMKWAWAALGLVVVALLARAWMRGRS